MTNIQEGLDELGRMSADDLRKAIADTDRQLVETAEIIAETEIVRDRLTAARLVLAKLLETKSCFVAAMN